MEMGFLWTSITFCRGDEFWIWKVRCDQGKILYKICENEPKIPVFTTISDVRGKPVCKGEMAKGGQGGRRKRPIRQVKTNSGGRKKGAKSILGSNHFGKVGVENFSFLACTLVFTFSSILAMAFQFITPRIGRTCFPLSNKNFTLF